MKYGLPLAVLWFALAAVPASAQPTDTPDPSVTAAAGRISIGGAVQFWLQSVQADPGRHVAGISEFRTRRLHLYLDGAPTDRVVYHIALNLTDDEPLLPHKSGLQIGVYEAYIEPVISNSWRVRVGTFIPHWTLTADTPVHQLEFIRYPLIVDSGEWLFTPGRQTGATITYRPDQRFFITVGLMNGLDASGQGYDDNAMKDTMVALAWEMYPGLRFSIGHWGGKTELRDQMAAPGETVYFPFGLTTVNDGATAIDVGGGLVEHSSTWLALEIFRGGFYLGAEALWNGANQDGEALRNCFGYQVSMSYAWQRAQALLRYEYFDPDSDNQYAKNTELEWTTLGLNYDLTPGCRLMANYLFKAERQDNQRADEEFLVQVSLGF